MKDKDAYRQLANHDYGYGFTLLELIVVIIIIGILATLGYTQYNNVVEHARGAEALTNDSQMRKLAYEYYYKNGTFLTLTLADIGVGTDTGLLPQNCVGTNFFHYGFDWAYQDRVNIWGYRCTSGGKSPQWGGGSYALYITVNPGAGDSSYSCWAPDNSCAQLGWPH